MRGFTSVVFLLQKLNATAGDNPVDPEIKRAPKTIATQLLVSSGEDCLKKFTGITFRTANAQSQSQDRSIIVAGKLGKRIPATRLRLTDQQCLIRIVGAIGGKKVRRDSTHSSGLYRLTSPRLDICWWHPRTSSLAIRFSSGHNHESHIVA